MPNAPVILAAANPATPNLRDVLEPGTLRIVGRVQAFHVDHEGARRKVWRRFDSAGKFVAQSFRSPQATI